MSSTHRAVLRGALITLAVLAAQQAVPAERDNAVRRAPKAAAAVQQQADVIVRFKANTERMRAQAAGDNVPRHAQAMALALGVPMSDGGAIDTRTQAMRATGISTEALIAKLSQHADVEAVYENRRRHAHAAPNDPRYLGGQTTITPAVGQWYLRDSSPTLVSSINAEGAWAVTGGSRAIVVAVLDTGVRPEHPDLAGKLLPGYDFISADSNGTFTTAADGNGRDADPTDPGDYFRDDPSSTSSWHGTQTAGLVGAATNNGIGMAAIGRDVKVLPVRVLGVDGGLDSDIIAGMKWASGIHVPGVPDNPQANWASVVNLSLGGTGACTGAYSDAIAALAARGTAVVVSAGNEDGVAVDSPANCPGAIGVAAVRHIGTKNGFSNVGPEVAISAPGGNCVNTGLTEPCLYPILTTTNAGLRDPAGSTYTDSFDASVGTSFSAPLVSGTLALMFAADPAMTVSEAVALMKATARPFPTTGANSGTPACHAPDGTKQDECYCTTSTCGAGLLDAGAALRSVLNNVGIVANIGVQTASPASGSAVSVTAGPTTLAPGSPGNVAYQWSIVDGGGIVSAFDSATNGPTASLTPTAGGSFILALSVVDGAGNRSSTQTEIQVSGASPSSGDSGGGGALGAGWLLLLGLGTAALALTRRRGS